MTRRTRTQWQALFNEYDQSGLTAAAFCREKKLCPKYFSLRRRQLNTKAVEIQEAAASPKSFVRAMVSAGEQRSPVLIGSADEIVLCQGDWHLSLPTSISPQWLASLINSLA